MTVSNSVVGNTKGFKVHHYFNDGEGISFDVHKSKPRKAVVVYRNLQVEDYRWRKDLYLVLVFVFVCSLYFLYLIKAGIGQ